VDVEPIDRDPDERQGRVGSIAVLIGVAAAVIAAATIWLLFTDPVTVASAVEDGEVTPLIRQLADVIYDALVSLFAYL
jgi:hypothetical protein